MAVARGAAAWMAFLACGLLGCSDRSADAPVSTDQVFVLSGAELAQVRARADRGDLSAIHQLIDHYYASANGDTDAERWRVRALALGDPMVLAEEAARLETLARMQKNPVEREHSLRQALAFASASQRAEPKPSTLSLVSDIERALKRMPQAARP